MAINSVLQTIRNAEVDARSLSEFVSKDAFFTVTRRLAPTIHTLDYYLLVLNNVKDKGDLADIAISDTLDKLEQLEPTVIQRVESAINNTAVEGGVLADTFVTATANGADRVARTQRDKNSDFVNIKDFGVVGDGIADDTQALTKAINSGLPLDWSDYVCKVTSPINSTYPSRSYISWRGTGASIVYEGLHTQYVVGVNGSGLSGLIDGVSVDANKQANTALYIYNSNEGMTEDNLGDFVIKNSTLSRAKRLKEFVGGSALRVRGAFKKVTLDEGFYVYDCELPPDQGTPGSIGISGASIVAFSETCYVREVLVRGARIENIYSSDPEYTADQDGIAYFGGRIEGGNVADSHLTVTGGTTFINCFGRSIKTQVTRTIVNNCLFIRDGAVGAKKGNAEVNPQSGDLVISDCTFDYSNGYSVEQCISCSSPASAKSGGATVRDCVVYLDDSTKLHFFFQPWSISRRVEPSYVDNIRVYGSIYCLVSLYANGKNSYVKISDCYVRDFYERDEYYGLCRVSKYGSLPDTSANVVIENCITDHPVPAPALVDSIPTVSMSAAHSCKGNIGFIEDVDGSSNSHNKLLNRVGNLAPTMGQGTGRKGYMEAVDTILVPGSSGSRIVNLKLSQTAIVFVTIAYAKGSYAIFHASSTSSAGSSISPIMTGRLVGVSDDQTPLPEDDRPTFEIRGAGNNEIELVNHDAHPRWFTVFAMVTY